ncbi:MAG: hypothetical protein GY827_09530 [Cytophagales bacterium]|nr:hypothetical protein [Cytophagales bacterium]
MDTEAEFYSFFGEIKSSELEQLLHFKKLKHLNVSCSDLFDHHLAIIGKIESLELLDIDSTEITNDGLKHLIPLKKLSALRLKDNPQLTDECIVYLAAIEWLELIHIGNTSITMEGLTSLLQKNELYEIILGSEFNDKIEELKLLTQKYPDLEITLKGTGIIMNCKLNQ